ncbi:MAG TPA: hypothetical protein PLC42_03130 [Parachlamydiaceae bacterium]|nr:hypothetical protein [Parachlamydiaceae bacterium]
MVYLRRKSLVAISGAIWLFAGALLMWKGINYLIDASQNAAFNGYPLIKWLSPYFSSIESLLLLLAAFALLIGFCKGKFILAKSAKRVMGRINNLSDPAPISKMYSLQYCLLLGAMIFLGISMKYLGIPEDVRGVVDVAVGASLINGSMHYFRAIYDTWSLS